MNSDDPTSEVVAAILTLVPDYPYVEVAEADVIDRLAQRIGDRTRAVELWEAAEPELRKRVVNQGRLFEWDFLQRLVMVGRPVSVVELDRLISVNEVVIPHFFEDRLRSLTGRAFERFMGELLTRHPAYRDVVVTRASRDDGVDFKAIYQPDKHGPPRRLIGQAKQTVALIGAPLARDFIGTLNILGEPGAFGLYVSTSGFTKDAIDTFKRSNYQIHTWDLAQIRSFASEHQIGIRAESGAFPVIETAFWDEIGNN